MQNITMSPKEANRIRILEKLKRKEIDQKTTALSLGLSTRQVRRIFKKYQQYGASGLIHQGRGKVSNRQVNQSEIDRAINLVKKYYPDFGPTLALEKLKTHHRVKFEVDTLRKAMIKSGDWKAKAQKKIVIHQSRPRRACEGELVQVDGSPFLWLEDRGKTEEGEILGMCSLLVGIDDATGKLKRLWLAPSESIESYFDFLEGYLKTEGKPLTFYVDKHSVFRKSSKQGEGTAQDSYGPTQFARALTELGIQLIFAHSPQAKGRVERSNQTLQDRLVKELRLKNITTIKQANNYFPEFIKEFNQKFGVKPANPHNLHQKLSQTEIDKLKDILLVKETRVIDKNLVVHYQNIEYQIQTNRPSYSLRKAKCEVWRDRDDQVKLVYKGKSLDYRIFKVQAKAEIVDSKRLNQIVDEITKNKIKTNIHNRTEYLEKARPGYQSYFDKLTEESWNSYISA